MCEECASKLKKPTSQNLKTTTYQPKPNISKYVPHTDLEFHLYKQMMWLGDFVKWHTL